MTETEEPNNEVLHSESVRLELVRNLMTFGVSRTKSVELVSHHSREEIRRQIEWLPYRAARTPASLLIAAIENNYAPPTLWDAQQNPKQ